MVRINRIPVELCKREALRFLGYSPRKSGLNPKIDGLIEEMMDMALLVINPRGVFITLEIKDIYEDCVCFQDSDMRLAGHGMAEYLSKCTNITFLASTVGHEIDTEIDRLFKKGDSARAVILDAVGSDAAEQSIGWLDKYIQKTARSRGSRTLARRSPGYGVWPISLNGSIGELLNVSDIGLNVQDSFQLVPRKSVLALVGWINIV